MHTKSTTVLCQQCGNPFNIEPYQARSTTAGKFCSRPCYWAHKKTHHKPIADRFWAKVKKTNGCWEWTGARAKKGYGIFQLGSGQGTVLSHRFAFELTYGPIPNGLWALHRCDNPPCCNPEHLFLGNVVDNVHDAMDKGRTSPPPLHIGEANHRAVMTPDLVRAIRAASEAGMSQRAIGQQFSTSQHNVWSIVKHLTWKHVD